MPPQLQAIKHTAPLPTTVWVLIVVARELLASRIIAWVNQHIDVLFLQDATKAILGDRMFFALIAAAMMFALLVHRSNTLEIKQTAWIGTLVTIRDTALYFKRLIDGDADRERWIIVDPVSHALQRMQLELPAFRLLIREAVQSLGTRSERDTLLNLGLLGDTWTSQQNSEWISDLRQIERFVDRAAGRLGLSLTSKILTDK